MNALDIMKYGHLTVLRAIDNLAEPHWQTGGVCGVWSVKDIVAHLASYELVLEDLLHGFAGSQPQSHLDSFLRQGMAFNDNEVALRKNHTAQQVLQEYTEAYNRVAALAPRVPPGKFTEAGTLPWYGAEYALDDYLVYQFYGHKREHTAQIAVFRDTLK